MKKFKIIPALSLMALCILLAGCVANEFKVVFSLDPSLTRTYPFLYYASDPHKGWIIENVASVDKGKAEIKCITREPCIVYIFDGAGDPATYFYARRGDKIKISGKGADPIAWEIGGNDINERLTAWRAANRSALLSRDRRRVNEAVAGYVAAHRDDPVSTILLLLDYDRSLDAAGFDKCWKSLDGDAKEPEWRNLASRSDMLDDLPHNAKFPSMIILKSYGTGCDTITPGSKPALLYFTKNSIATHRSDIDTLRRLTREFPDSSSRVIADINFEPDSITRVMPISGDSLAKAIRAWMPLGISDDQAREMNVASVPCFIVLDRKGKIVYKGDDSGDAARLFRKAMR